MYCRKCNIYYITLKRVLAARYNTSSLKNPLDMVGNWKHIFPEIFERIAIGKYYIH